MKSIKKIQSYLKQTRFNDYVYVSLYIFFYIYNYNIYYYIIIILIIKLICAYKYDTFHGYGL